MRTILTLLLGVVLVTSCSEDTYLWNEADRVKDYSRSLVGNNVQLVDHLDRIFRAFEYREDVLSGKDGQIIIDRYFSDEHWRLLYNEENDELIITMGIPQGAAGYLSIINSGKSLLQYFVKNLTII